MTLLEMIKEWRKGCTNAPNFPVCCPKCTDALIDAMEFKLNKEAALKKLKHEFEIEMLEIKSRNYGIASVALFVACYAKYAGQARVISRSTNHELKSVDINVKFECAGGVSQTQLKDMVNEINKSLDA